MEQPDVVALWFRYEEIAMHFNNLLIQYRLHLMGGVGAIGTIAGLLSARVTNPREHHRLRAFVSSGLLLLMAMAASLDIFYYNQLLQGAVQAILDLEKQHPAIQMSTTIEAHVGRGKNTIIYVYLAILLPLATYAAWSWWEYWRIRRAYLSFA